MVPIHHGKKPSFFFCSPPKRIQQIGKISIWWLVGPDSHKPWGNRKAEEFLAMPLPCNSVFISLLAVSPWKLSTDQAGAGTGLQPQLTARERSIWPPALCQHMPESLQWHQGSREEEWATSWDSSAALAMLPTSPKVSLIDSTNTVGDVSHWNLGWFRWFKPVESLQQEMLFAEYTSGLLHGKQLLSSGSSPQKLEEPHAIIVEIANFRDF